MSRILNSKKGNKPKSKAAEEGPDAGETCDQARFDRLNGKCLDWEGCSKRQNLRITGLKEGADHGQTSREFAVGQLKEVLELEEKPVIDWAHRILGNLLRDNEQPGHLIIKIHHGHVFHNKSLLQDSTESGLGSNPNPMAQNYRLPTRRKPLLMPNLCCYTFSIV